MKYVKSLLAALLTLALAMFLFTMSLDRWLHLDARYYIGRYPIAAVLIMVIVFTIAFSHSHRSKLTS
jgi:hypothetical protein